MSKPDPQEVDFDLDSAREAIAQSKWNRRPPEETFKLGRYAITGRIASGGMATV
jgi:eukaryotic-like serine/threonine-protein kinase